MMNTIWVFRSKPCKQKENHNSEYYYRKNIFSLDSVFKLTSPESDVNIEVKSVIFKTPVILGKYF